MAVAPVPSRELTRSVALFLLTTLSVWSVYVVDRMPTLAWPDEGLAQNGAVFAGSLMAVLLCHEMGHFLVARVHGFSTSPPAFIPFPLPGTFGTMGAVIRLRSLPRSREALLEMGAAGPIAGALVAFALLLYGVPLTQPPDSLQIGETYGIFNDPLVVKLIGIRTTGAAPDRYGTYHPTAMAGWVGCLLTGINLLPVGQLDGGHVFNALAPRIAPRVSRLLYLASIAAVAVYAGQVLWALSTGVAGAESPTPVTAAIFILVLRLLGGTHPLPVPEQPDVPLRARLIAALALLLLVLTFMPFPIEIEVYQGG